MSLSIKNRHAHHLAQELAAATGETITSAVVTALEERLAAVRRHQSRARIHADVADIQRFVASLPVRDPRPADEILGYDDFGLPR